MTQTDLLNQRHYRFAYQHWDWVNDMDFDYFIGNATKYLCRNKHKGGVEDLKKALTYVLKMKELEIQSPYPSIDMNVVKSFINQTGINKDIQEAIRLLCKCWHKGDYDEIIARLEELIHDRR